MSFTGTTFDLGSGNGLATKLPIPTVLMLLTVLELTGRSSEMTGEGARRLKIEISSYNTIAASCPEPLFSEAGRDVPTPVADVFDRSSTAGTETIAGVTDVLPYGFRSETSSRWTGRDDGCS